MRANHQRRAIGLAIAVALTASPIASAFVQEAPATAAPSSNASSAEPYSRSRDDADGNAVLELASRTFAPKSGSGPNVVLVAAVHVADESFYAAMQSMLDAQDLVLFEGVRPPGAGSIDPNATDEERAKATHGRLDFLKTAITSQHDRDGAWPNDFDDLVTHAGKRWKSVVDGVRVDGWSRPIRFERLGRVEATAESPARPERIVLTSDGIDGASQQGAGDDLRVEIVIDDAVAPRKPKDAGIQTKLAKALGVTFQLDAIDSSKPNWQSSDMSIDQLEARFAEAGADATMLMGMMDGSSLLGKLAGLMLDFVGKNPQMQAMAKLMLVEALGAAEGGLGGGGAMPVSMEKLMKVILLERNAVVLKDLRDVIDHRKDVKSVAIFYGAGHMGDLERRLCDEFGYAPTNTTWTVAMRVNPRDAGYSPKQAKAMRESLRRMIESASKSR
ncbi:MAG: hypothetical protein U0572_07730 [Phycisphaerales bacterium]